jgi:hypothetical protein
LESTCMPKSQVDCHKFQGSALDFQLDVAVMNPVHISESGKIFFCILTNDRVHEKKWKILYTQKC